jgi:diguanylate cyclase (GGDEF)-like protein
MARILLALHRPAAVPSLADGLRAAGHEVVETANLVDTAVALRRHAPQAVLVQPLSQDPASPEWVLLLSRVEGPDGPALLVLTAEPELLPARVAAVADFLPPDTPPERAERRLRFLLGRREVLARQAAEHARLSRDAITDFKTGLFNDRYFAERCREESARARRTRRPVAVLAMDFDDFKAINDTHGHECGDRALAAFAQALRTSLRASDVPARPGGDEFLALLPDSDLADAVRVAARVRRLVSDLRVEHAGKLVPLSVSFGVSAVTHQQVHTVEDAVRAADDALMAAKRGGKGEVWVKRPEDLRAQPAREERRGEPGAGDAATG